MTIQAQYSQLSNSTNYMGKERNIDLKPGVKAGTKLERFLMDKNPVENTVTICLTKGIFPTFSPPRLPMAAGHWQGTMAMWI